MRKTLKTAVLSLCVLILIKNNTECRGQDIQFICENDVGSISCPENSRTTLNITYANYGRTSTAVCVHALLPSSRTDCPQQLENALGIVKGFCQNEHTCKLNATNDVFNDTCLDTFKYLEVRYNCQSISDCGEPRPPTDGAVTEGELTTFGATRTYICDKGYDLIGNHTTTCQPSGNWSSSASCRKKDCGFPPSPIHGSVLLTNDSITAYGTIATQFCNQGYRINGNSTLRCEASGNWSISITCFVKGSVKVYVVVLSAVAGVFGIGLVSISAFFLIMRYFKKKQRSVANDQTL